MVERAALAAGFDMKIHPHMLRHACGYKLANEGVDTRTIQGYLGHVAVQLGMSALGQKQTCALHQPMSALPPKATSNAPWDCLLRPNSGPAFQATVSLARNP